MVIMAVSDGALGLFKCSWYYNSELQQRIQNSSQKYFVGIGFHRMDPCQLKQDQTDKSCVVYGCIDIHNDRKPSFSKSHP